MEDNKRPQIETRHSEIAGYWMNKFIHPDGSVTDKPDGEGMLMCMDVGEPECFICGKSPMCEPDFSYKRHKKLLHSDNFLRVWDMAVCKRILERAHIIPYALGGEDKPSNMVCLCKRCHKNAPNTNDYDAFIRYIYDERTSGRYVMGIAADNMQKLYCLMLESGITNEDVMRFRVDDYIKMLTPTDDFQMTKHFGEDGNESTLFASFRKSIAEYVANNMEQQRAADK